MKLEFIAPLEKENKGIDELLKLISKKGTISFDFKKGKTTIEDFSSEKIDTILSIVREYFDVTYLNLNNDKKFKLLNSEKELQSKKAILKEGIKRKPNTIISKVQEYILKEKVFTLSQLREEFPKTNFATLRSYVNDMKNNKIIIELERGKYAVR